MFIKITKSGKYEYVQIVQSRRVNGRVTHEVLMNLGRRDEIENNPMFQRLANKLAELSGLLVDRKDLGETSEAIIRNWGYVIYKRLWQFLELDACLEEIRKKDSKARFNLAQTSFLMVLQHLLEPRSKLGAFNHQDRYAKLPKLELQHLYRSLDILSENKDKIEDHIFGKNYNLFHTSVDIVFYDVTTFAFESVNQDGLRDFGYSTDNKYNEVHVVMGLLIDGNGFPVGYELFNSSTFDGKTMIEALKNLKRRFGIRRVVIVADRGLNSKFNLKMMHEAGYGYIVASRVRKMSRPIQKQIFDSAGYIEIAGPDGYYGIQTSEQNMKAEEILSAYHTLWRIKESFRIMKSTLEVRPVFHWTEKRIRGHFVICFLAFLLERKLEHRLKEARIPDASPEKIREAINRLEFVEIEMNGQPYYIKTKGTELSNKILKAMGIQPPKNFLPISKFKG